jgi:hypothetical protein
VNIRKELEVTKAAKAAEATEAQVESSGKDDA